jgi:integrase
MNTRLAFTRPRLLAIPPPPTGRTYHYDTQQKSLTACVTAAGCRTFYVYRKINGHPTRIRLGKVDEITVDDARSLCREIVGQMASGHDPMAVRRARRREGTFGSLFEHWLETYAKPRTRTWKESERVVNTLLPSLLNRRLGSITRSEIAALHARLGRDHGRYAANRALSLVKGMFNRASGIGYDGPNPAKGIEKFPEQKRDRFLHADELPRFFQALAEEPDATVRDFLLVCLLCGARRGNVQTMAWADVDFDRRVWRIPTTKTGQPVTVPLSPPLVKLLQDRRINANGSPYVFPGKLAPTVTNVGKVWAVIRTRAGLPDLRIHDLRRSLGSWQAMTGASLPIIGKSLGHLDSGTTEIYARLQLDPVRESVDKATVAMLTAGGLLTAADAPVETPKPPRARRPK